MDRRYEAPLWARAREASHGRPHGMPTVNRAAAMPVARFSSRTITVAGAASSVSLPERAPHFEAMRRLARSAR
jgi:hypothetical protein